MNVGFLSMIVVKNLLTRMLKHKVCERARRHLNYNH
ncbi:hypothetical protein LINPERHAP1_LOCUS1560 [Linum perenne]